MPDEGACERASEESGKKRKDDVTTRSILEDFLLVKTSLDDTITAQELIKALDAAAGSTKKKTSAKTSSA